MRRNPLRTTETRTGKVAVWQIVDRNVRVVRLRVAADATPAYLYPRTPLPAVQPGTVVFDNARLPDLAQVREWFPRHEDLWNAVRDDYWSALLEQVEGWPRPRPARGAPTPTPLHRGPRKWG
ncbi:hypothetical protein [Nocardia farcinica]|uniref:hypothetical protein n=1 Tax=Nocardia farcinica TaxID=37329 RepID=UPI00245660F6|nr:hypothetical protein [Nocardia farcinica]